MQHRVYQPLASGFRPIANRTSGGVGSCCSKPLIQIKPGVQPDFHLVDRHFPRKDQAADG